MLNLFVGSSFRRLQSHLLRGFAKIYANNNPYKTGPSNDMHYKMMAQTLANTQHKRFLQSQVLIKGKHVLVGDLREEKDTIFSLRSRGKCPGVIRREGFEDVDVVLSGKQMKIIYNDARRRASPVIVRAGGQDIKCLIDEIVFHGQMFIQKVEFRRFIEGQPNHISVPIQFKGLTENYAFVSGTVPKLYTGNLSLITYNQDYPPCIFIDVSYVHPLRPYKIADVANMLPPGIEVHPKHNLNQRLFTIGNPKNQVFGNRYTQETQEGNEEQAEDIHEMAKASNKAGKAKLEGAKSPAAGGKAPAGAEGKAPAADQKKTQSKK